VNVVNPGPAVLAVTVAFSVAACGGAGSAPADRCGATASSLRALEPTCWRATDGTTLLSETFADPSLRGWTLANGATVGEGEASRVTVQDGALSLDANASTRRFVAVERDLPVAGTHEVSVQVRMRTEDVEPAAARYRNCDAYVRFDGGPVTLASRVGMATTSWSRSTRILTVPQGAHTMTL
jgi:hypothetical protein